MKMLFFVTAVIGMIIVGGSLYIQAEKISHYEKGKQLLEEKKYDEALAEYRQALSSDDPQEKKFTLLDIASIHMNRKQYSEAAEYYREARKIDPDYLYTNEMLGIVLYGGLGDHESAFEPLLKAEELKSGNSLVYFALACCYSLKNEKEKSFHYLDLAIIKGFRKPEYIASEDFNNIKSDSRYIRLAANFSSISEGDKYIYKGIESQGTSDNESAMKSYLAASELYSKALWEDSLNMDMIYGNLAQTGYSMKDFDSAVLYYEKLVSIRLVIFGEKDNKTAAAFNGLGMAYEGKRDYNNAFKNYEKSLEIKTALFGENHQNLMGVYANLSRLYGSLYNYEKEAYYLRKSLNLQISMFGEKSELVLGAYSYLGKSYQQKGDYKNALACYDKALQISLELHGENHSDTAVCYALFGYLYSLTGDYSRSVTYYEKALKISIAVSGEKSIGTATYYSHLGVSYGDSGNYDLAVEYCEKALNVALELRGEKDLNTANYYFHLGHAYRDSGEYERALASYGKAVNIWRVLKGENDLSTAFGYSCMALVYDDMKNYKLAVENHEKALNIGIVIVGSDNPDAANAYHNLGWSCWSGGDLKRGIEYLEKSAAIIKKFEKNQAAIRIYQNLGLLYINAGRYADATAIHRSSIETIERVRRLNLSGGTDFTSRNINTFYYAMNSCYLQKDMESMFNISERMRAMGYVERLSIGSAIEGAGIDPGKGKKLMQLRDDIERLSSMRQKVISEPVTSMNEKDKAYHDALLERVSVELAQAESDFNTLESGFMKNEKYKLLRDSSVVSVKTAQELCGKDGAVIEYVIPEKPDKYMKPYAVIITGSSINAVELDSSYNYSGQIEKYRKSIKENNSAETESIGIELYGKLVEPLKSHINPLNIKRLVIVPDGSLAFLPFDSIRSADGRYLSAVYEINLTPSVTVSSMIKKRKYSRRDNLMAFGGGVYSAKGESSTRGNASMRGIILEEGEKGRLAVKAYNTPLEYYSAQKINWIDLPGTEREVLAINEKIYHKKNSDMYTGKNVTEENLKSLSKNGRLKKYSSIHFACHGYYDPEYPGYSAVVFSEVSGKLKESKEDGYMSVEETALLSLQSEIVVLSACETGLGRIVRGDGVIGLTRAFQVAGSNRVLVTLWQVSDEATEAFMVAFYAKVRAGMSYSGALVKVKEEFRSSGGSGGADYSAPYYWAGFVLYE